MLKNRLNLVAILGLFMFAVLMGLGYAPYYANEDDNLETLFAGRDYGISHHKHPPFSLLQAQLAFKLFGFGFYLLLAPLQMATMLTCMFLLGLEVFKDRKKALLALLFALAITFYISYLKFNANTAGYALYGFITLLFYKAVMRGKYALFLPISVLAALIILTKYSGVILLASFAVVLFATKEGRKALRSTYPYLGGALFLASIGVWFVIKYKYNNSLGLEYLAGSVQKQNTPLIFYILSQIGYLAIFLGVFFAMRPRFKGFSKADFNGVFLLAIGVAPLVLVPITFDLFVGGGPMAFWMLPFYFLLPTATVYFFDFKTPNPLKFAAKIIIPVISVIVAATIVQRNIRPLYDAKGMAEFIEITTEGKKIDYYICHRNFDHPWPCYYLYMHNQQHKFITYDGSFTPPKEAKAFVLVSSKEESPEPRTGYKMQTAHRSFEKVYRFVIFPSCESKICKKLLKRTRPQKDDVYLYIFTPDK